MSRLIARTLIGLSFAFSLFAGAFTANRVNGSATIIYIDFSLPGISGIPLELVRTYNSITAQNETTGWQGAFGWGWTSPFETTLTTTPERHVILRDGGSGSIVIFRPRKEDPKVQELFLEGLQKAYFESQTGRKLTKAELGKFNFPEKMSRQLKSDPMFRAEMASRYGIRVAIPQGQKLVSLENGYQTIYFKKDLWVREKDGITQLFDKNGRLVTQIDKNGFEIHFKYSTNGQISEISDKDRLVILKMTMAKDRVVEIIDNQARKARYTYDGNGNLSSMTNSKGETFNYKYEARKFPHLLTKVEYPGEGGKEKTQRELRYDENGMLVYHKDRDGAESNFTYGKSQNAPEDQFWTKTTIKLGSTTREEYDAFFLGKRADGSKYLYKRESQRPGENSVTVFNECCAKPLQVTKNGQVTNLKYYENGLLKEKVGPGEDLRVSYDTRWEKVSTIVQNGVTSNYTYDDRGNLISGKNSKGKKVSFVYQPKTGRIAQMSDGKGNGISFEYNRQGRPSLISDKELGAIRLSYDAVGRVSKTEGFFPRDKGRKPSEARAREIVQKVMLAFQNMLDIIRPAGAVVSATET